MSSWGFDKEGTQNAGGANTEDFLVSGFQPFYEADSIASKRNVIGTDLGWVRRVNYTDTHGNARNTKISAAGRNTLVNRFNRFSFLIDRFEGINE